MSLARREVSTAGVVLRRVGGEGEGWPRIHRPRFNVPWAVEDDRSDTGMFPVEKHQVSSSRVWKPRGHDPTNGIRVSAYNELDGNVWSNVGDDDLGGEEGGYMVDTWFWEFMIRVDVKTW